MALLTLPVELLETILRDTTTDGFIQAIYSCKCLLSVAAGSQRLLLHHLHLIPGELDPSWEALGTQELLRLVCTKAGSQTLGTESRADAIEYPIDSGVFDLEHSGVFQIHGSCIYVLVRKQPSQLLLFACQDGQLKLQRKLDIPSSPSELFDIISVEGSAEGGSLSVLMRCSPISVDSQEAGDDSGAGVTYRLVHFLIDESFSKVQTPRWTLPRQGNLHPRAVAVQNPAKLAVSWHILHENAYRCVAVYKGDLGDLGQRQEPDSNNLDYEGKVIASVSAGRNERALGSISKLSFSDNGSQLLFHRASTLIYEFYRRTNRRTSEAQGRVFRNTSFASYRPTGDSWVELTIATPFYGSHRQEHLPGAFGSRCHWNYLALGVGNHPDTGRQLACLVSTGTDCRSSVCEHILNLDRGRRFGNWTAVADLVGFEVPAEPRSDGISYAPSGTRIALANGSIILVWSLLPEVVIKGPETYLNHYREPMIRDGFLQLTPAILDVGKELLALRFVTDEVLLALTTEGASLFTFGQQTKGLRRQAQLEQPLHYHLADMDKRAHRPVTVNGLSIFARY